MYGDTEKFLVFLEEYCFQLVFLWGWETSYKKASSYMLLGGG